MATLPLPRKRQDWRPSDWEAEPSLGGIAKYESVQLLGTRMAATRYGTPPIGQSGGNPNTGRGPVNQPGRGPDGRDYSPPNDAGAPATSSSSLAT